MSSTLGSCVTIVYNIQPSTRIHSQPGSGGPTIIIITQRVLRHELFTVTFPLVARGNTRLTCIDDQWLGAVVNLSVAMLHRCTYTSYRCRLNQFNLYVRPSIMYTRLVSPTPSRLCVCVCTLNQPSNYPFLTCSSEQLQDKQHMQKCAKPIITCAPVSRHGDALARVLARPWGHSSYEKIALILD